MSELLKLAEKISKYCVGMEGNISSKTRTLSGDFLTIKASGSKLSNLTNDDLVDFNFNGVQLSNHNKKGSMELSFHMFLLGFDEINYVSHTHPTNTLKLLCTNYVHNFSTKRLFPDQVVFNGKKSCFVPYAKPGVELTEKIKKYVNLFIEKEGYFPKLILLGNHGIITCGKTIDECVISTDICEKSAEIFVGCSELGDIIFLGDSEIDELINDDNEKYRQKLIK